MTTSPVGLADGAAADFCAVRDVTFRYFEDSKRNVLEGTTLGFRRGEVAVVCGPSGCGKSTLAAIMCGLYPENGGFLESGTVTVGGRDLAGLPFSERTRHIAQMFQNPDLQFAMRDLREELHFVMENRLVPAEQMDARAEEFALRYHVGDLLDAPFARLSGGEKQRAALACLLLVNPEVMVLDEPFANLDAAERARYLELLGQKVREDHTTVIAVDHQPGNWVGVADRYVVLGEGGRVLRDDISAATLPDSRAYLVEHGVNDPLARPERRFWPSEAGETDGSAAEAVLQMRDVSVFHKGAKNPQVRGLSLTAHRGEMIALLGPSGCGKTTLFMALLGQKPYAGSILLGGRELRRLRRRELYQRVGMVFQNPSSQFVSTSALDEVAQSVMIWRHADREAAEAQALELLDSYGLKRLRRYSPFMLSQGQQRRLAVLTALAGGQDLLLLDEPTYGQDGRTTEHILGQMRQSCSKGVTMVFSTHDEVMAYRYADRIWRMGEGTVHEER